MSDLTGRQPKAITSAMELLEALARAGAGASAAELAAATGIPRATAYRLLNLLVAEEFVVRMPDLSGFALGARVGALVEAAAPPRVPSAVRSELLELRAGMRPAVHLLLVRGDVLRVADEDPAVPLERLPALEALLAGGVEHLPGPGWVAVAVRSARPVAVLLVVASTASPAPPTSYLDRVVACAKVLEPLLD